MSRRRTRAKAQISTHTDQTWRVKVIGCSVNFADQSQVGGKTAPLEHLLRGFSSATLLGFLKGHLSVHSSATGVVLRLRCVICCYASASGMWSLFSVLNLSLYAQRGPATRSHQQHSFKECVFKLREDVRVPFGSQLAAVT